MSSILCAPPLPSSALSPLPAFFSLLLLPSSTPSPLSRRPLLPFLAPALCGSSRRSSPRGGGASRSCSSSFGCAHRGADEVHRCTSSATGASGLCPATARTWYTALNPVLEPVLISSCTLLLSRRRFEADGAHGGWGLAQWMSIEHGDGGIKHGDGEIEHGGA